MKLARKLWAIAWVLCRASAALAGEPAVTLHIAADSVQPEGLPIVLTLTVDNQSNEAIYFWRDGGADYPDACHFVVNAVDLKTGRRWEHERLSNSNDQLAADSGRLRPIASGRSLSFPAALRPLPPGSYRISVEGEPQGRWSDGKLVDVWFPATASDEPVRIEVRADDALAQKRDEQMIAKIRAGDPFAEYVAGRFPREQVWNALEAALSGDDIVAAEGAIDTFWPDRNPSEEAAPTIARAIRSHLKPINDGHDEWMMHQLVGMSRQLNTREITAAVTQLSAARPQGRVHDYAAQALAELDPKRTPANPVKEPTAEAPDDRAIDALLKLAQSEHPRSRISAYEALAGFSGNPRAVAALRNGMLDRDDGVRKAAEKALRNLEADQEWRKRNSFGREK